MAETKTLLELDSVSKAFSVRGSHFAENKLVKAVNNVSMTLNERESVGLVGESGCGKSTLGRMICGLLQPTSGQVLFAGQPLPLASATSPVIGRIQMVFQDPFSSLNPRMRVGESVAEGLKTHGMQARGMRFAQSVIDAKVAELFAVVGLEGMQGRYPHEFSGGQRQRIALARALVTNPDLVVCDEPVSALDASVQAQVLNVMRDLQERFGQAQLFISHNLAIVGFMCERVLVMYLGEIVEELASAQLAHGAHPYTRALYKAMPGQSHRGVFTALQGEMPSPLDPPPGCPFHPRCPQAQALCRKQKPAWQSLSATWRVRCHFAQV